MVFMAWLFQRASISAARRPATRLAGRFRPSLEVLEGRALPAVVTTAVDVIDRYDGVLSLREAVLDATPGETITFAANVSKITLGGQELLIDKSLTIQGSGADATTISGGGVSRVFEVAATQVTLSGLTISDGHAACGGGILINGSLSLIACRLIGNTAFDNAVVNGIYEQGAGAAIYNHFGSLTVTGCTLSGNSAAWYGGGIYSVSTGESGAMSLGGCTMSSNSAEFGGAVYLTGDGRNGDATQIAGSTFSANTARSGGGAIFNEEYLALTNCTLSSNSALFGGAVYGRLGSNAFGESWGSLTMTGCTLTGNSATHSGGAVYNATTMTLSNCTISANSATYGGGINTSGDLTIRHCTLTKNSATSGGGILNRGSLWIGDKSSVTSNTAKEGADLYNDRFNGGSCFIESASKVSKVFTRLHA